MFMRLFSVLKFVTAIKNICIGLYFCSFICCIYFYFKTLTATRSILVFFPLVVNLTYFAPSIAKISAWHWAEKSAPFSTKLTFLAGHQDSERELIFISGDKSDVLKCSNFGDDFGALGERASKITTLRAGDQNPLPSNNFFFF